MKSSSTLNPGGTPDYVKKLREAAIKEMDKGDRNTTKRGDPKFDIDHETPPTMDITTEEFDRRNGVAQYPGQNCPHIGNGTGGAR